LNYVQTELAETSSEAPEVKTQSGAKRTGYTEATIILDLHVASPQDFHLRNKNDKLDFKALVLFTGLCDTASFFFKW